LNERRPHRPVLGLLLIFALAALLHMILIAAWYTKDLRRFESGDYALYAIGAQHIATHGDFSNSLFLVRPPLFPLLILVLGRSDLAVVVVNALIGALIPPLTVILAWQLGLPHWGAWLAGLLAAVDPAGIVYSAFLGPEPLANLLLLAAVIVLLHAVSRRDRAQAVGWGAAAGILLALSSYTRPAAYLVWIVLGVWLLVTYRQQWKAVVAFMLVTASSLAVWIAHNGVVFHYYTFSTVSPYAMLYYRAASVEHLATNHDMNTVYTTLNQRVEKRLGHDPTGVGADQRQHYLAATPQIAAALNAVAIDIFKAHPLWYVLTIPIGFSRMYGLTTVALGRSPRLLAALEIGWNAVFLLGTCYGLWLAFRHERWLLFWCVLLLCGYFTVGTLLVKSAGMTTRERSMLTPLMAVATAYAAVVVRERREKAVNTVAEPLAIHL
jgi:hypothetical protein